MPRTVLNREAIIAAGSASALANLVVPPIAWGISGALFIAMLGLMSADLFTAYYSNPRELRGAFDWGGQIMRRAFLLLMVPVSLTADVIVYIAASMLPTRFAVLESGYLFLFLTTMLWLSAASLSETVKHIRAINATHPDSIPPTLEWMASAIMLVIRSMRKVDRARWATTHTDGSEPPARWTDGYTEAELAELLRRISETPPEQVPPDPDELLEEGP